MHLTTRSHVDDANYRCKWGLKFFELPLSEVVKKPLDLIGFI